MPLFDMHILLVRMELLFYDHFNAFVYFCENDNNNNKKKVNKANKTCAKNRTKTTNKQIIFHKHILSKCLMSF